MTDPTNTSEAFEDRVFLWLVLGVSLAFIWILRPYAGAILWGTRTYRRREERRLLAQT